MTDNVNTSRSERRRAIRLSTKFKKLTPKTQFDRLMVEHINYGRECHANSTEPNLNEFIKRAKELAHPLILDFYLKNEQVKKMFNA